MKRLKPVNNISIKKELDKRKKKLMKDLKEEAKQYGDFECPLCNGRGERSTASYSHPESYYYECELCLGYGVIRIK